MQAFASIHCRSCLCKNPAVFTKVKGATCLCLDCDDFAALSTQMDELDAVEDAAIDNKTGTYWLLTRKHRPVRDAFAKAYQAKRQREEVNQRAALVAAMSSPF